MSVVTLFLSPSLGRGTPEGQGVGRRRKRAKPTSGATRHLLPEEGGRSGMSSPSTPFPWKGNARRARGWSKAKKSEANLRRYAPPPSKGRRGRWAGGWSRKAWEVLIESQRQILQGLLYIASRRDAFASLYYRRRCPKVVFKSQVTQGSRSLL